MKLYKICNKISLLLHVLASAAGYFVMEAICRHSFIEAWNYMTQRPLVFAYNAAFIFTSSLIVYLFHRRVFWRILVTLFWLILAIINGVLLLNRVTPFTGPDLHLIRNNTLFPLFGSGSQLLSSFFAPYDGCFMVSRSNSIANSIFTFAFKRVLAVSIAAKIASSPA